MKNLILAFCLFLAVIPTLPAEDAMPKVCPRCGHSFLIVPILIGFPTVEMAERVKRGEALLGGCVGNPAHPKQAFVCLACRQYRTAESPLWQPLPTDFASKKQPREGSGH